MDKSRLWAIEIYEVQASLASTSISNDSLAFSGAHWHRVSLLY